MEKRASWLELFYDLIFVVAFIQLGNGLAGDLSLPALLTFARVFTQLWVVWTGLTFFVNRFTLDDFMQRTMVLLQLLSVAAMALTAPQALEGRHAALSVAAGFAQLLVALMYFRTYVQEPQGKPYSRFWGLSFCAAGLVWLAAAMAPREYADPISLLATLALLTTPLSGRSRQLMERFPLDLKHLSERYGLLTIVVLGESFVPVLASLGGEHPDGLPWTATASTLLLASSLWWIYFDDVAGSRIRTGRGQWVVWLYGHLPLQMALVVLAVGLHKVLGLAADSPASESVSALLLGALAMAYFAVAALDSATERRQAELSDRARINARAATGLLLLALVPATRLLPAFWLIPLAAAVGALQVLFDLVVAPHEDSPGTHARAESTAELSRRQRREGGALPRIRTEENQILRKGTPTELRRDLYFFLMEGSFWRVLSAFSGLFLVANVFFAALYLAEPEAVVGVAPGSFSDAFFFSVQTMSTIGYGALAPQSLWGNVVVTAEAALSLIGVAMVTGLLFARLSRPRAAVLFSEPILLGRIHGKPALMFRAANARGNEVVDAQVTFTALMDELTPEGHHFRRLVELPVVRSRSPMFMLSWTVMHTLDEDSPLKDVDWERADEQIAGFVVTLMGHDSTYGQITYARHRYDLGSLRIGHRFEDVIHQLPDGRTLIDYEHFHDTVAEDA